MTAVAAATMICNLRSCSKEIAGTDARVEICGNLKGFHATLKSGKSAITWRQQGGRSKTGQAAFHRACYVQACHLAEFAPPSLVRLLLSHFRITARTEGNVKHYSASHMPNP